MVRVRIPRLATDQNIISTFVPLVLLPGRLLFQPSLPKRTCGFVSEAYLGSSLNKPNLKKIDRKLSGVLLAIFTYIIGSAGERRPNVDKARRYLSDMEHSTTPVRFHRVYWPL